MIIKYFTSNGKSTQCEVMLPDIERVEKSFYQFEDVLEQIEKEEAQQSADIWRGSLAFDEDGLPVITNKKQYSEADNRNAVYLWIRNQPSSDFEFENMETASGSHRVDCVADLCRAFPIARIRAIGKTKAYEIVTTQRVYIMSDNGKTIDKIN